MVGLIIDWHDWDRHYGDAGLIPPKDETPIVYEMMLYDDDGDRVGYTTSFMYSPMLQRHIAMARVQPGSGEAADRRSTSSSPSTTATTPLPRWSPGRRCSTRPERQPDTDAMPSTSTSTRSSSAAATTDWSTARTSPSRDCSTLIIERRHIVGGAAITEELIPGFHFTTFSYALSLLRPDIIHELELTKHGFMPIQMPSCVRADGERRLPADGHRPQREPQGDRPALQARCRRDGSVRVRHGAGVPGVEAAGRRGAAEPVRQRSRRRAAAGRSGQAPEGACRRECCRTASGC